MLNNVADKSEITAVYIEKTAYLVALVNFLSNIYYQFLLNNSRVYSKLVTIITAKHNDFSYSQQFFHNFRSICIQNL